LVRREKTVEDVAVVREGIDKAE